MNFLKKLLPKSDKDRFAETMIEALRKSGETRRISYAPGEFVLHVHEADGSSASTLGLHNAYEEFSRVAEPEKDQVVARYVRIQKSSGAELPDVFEKAIPNLLPRVQERWRYEMIDLQMEVQNTPAPFKMALIQAPFAEHFAVTLAYDFPEHIASVSGGNLEKWNVSLDHAITVATQTLRDRTELPLVRVGDGLFVSDTRDTYDATRVLLTDYVQKCCKFSGAIVAFIINRDCVFYADATNAAALAHAVELSGEALNDPRAMVFYPVILENGKWLPFAFPKNNNAYNKCRLLMAQSFGRIYAEQKDLLEQLLSKKHEDVFVATYLATMAKETGEVMTYATWTDGVPALLPEAEWIMFTQGQNALGRAKFSDVLNDCADLIREYPGLYPKRYSVNGFPSAEQLKRLIQP